ncbi:hypothetical protein LGM90_10145 [Burkholderia sp. AU28942]|uniref:hypothetical protein n=1 Tax=Burkholderia TaxID=32008 RepID=UPI0012EA5A47|nr:MULTISPECIES: hypothetical protein [Burkholderia]MCA8308868.1 hypothetical protein [Burkholderia sp. AU28942]QTO50869.1 hypothetical protein J8I86_15520 [Burkholderia latens]
MSLRHVLVLCALLVANAAHSQQLPPATASLNKVIAATVEKKAAQMGYTSLSQVVEATEEAMGRMAARAAATEGAAASWLAIPAAMAAVAAATMAFPTALSDQAVDQWQYNKDGTISITGNPKVSGGTITPQFPPLNSSTPLWGGSVGGPIGYGGSANAAAQAAAQAWTTQSQSGTKWTMAVKSCTSISPTVANCTYTEKDASGNLIGNPTGGVQQSGTFSHGTCASGLYYNNACQAYIPPPGSPPVVQPQTVSPSDAIAQIPSSDLPLPLAPDFIADISDVLWQSASQEPGYNGIPYPVDNPITAGDAGEVESSSPSSWPTIGGATSPVSSPSGAPASNNPYAIPSGSTSSGSSGASSPAATPPTVVDLGPNPGVAAPTLETIPTAAQILAPILGLLPDLKSFGVPAHTGQCPQPSISLFGRVYTVTSHCTLAEQLRPQIYTTFVLAFSLAALFIVLTA